MERVCGIRGEQQRAAKGLFLYPLPVKIDADFYIQDGEKSFSGRIGCQQNFIVTE